MSFIIQQSDEYLTSQSGLALVGALLWRYKLSMLVDKINSPQARSNTFPNSDVAVSMTGLLTQGKCDFEDIGPFRYDKFFVQSLRLSKRFAPSSPTIRQRLDAASDKWDQAVLEANTGMLAGEAEITPCWKDYVPLDLDVSPFDNSNSKKEGVSCTYKKIDGYAPIFAHLGKEGHLVNLQLREGKTHCQCGTPEFLRNSIKIARKITDKPLLVRLDSGNDSVDNIKVCRNEGADFIIKRNLRKESLEDWLWIAQTYGRSKEPRPGKVEYLGSLKVSHGELDEPIRIVFKVVLRTIDRNGQYLITPEIEVETYWTSLTAPHLTIIDLYNDHGTSEQFHSEFKGDMGLERLPSGYFATNTRVMFLGLMAYNILRLIGQSSLKFDYYAKKRKKVFRRRLRSVIQDLIYLASRMVYHANRLRISFGRYCPLYEVFKQLYYRWAFNTT